MDHMIGRALTPTCRIPHAGRKVGVNLSFLSRDDLHPRQQSSHDDPEFCQELENTDIAYAVLHPLLLPITLAALAITIWVASLAP